VARQRVNVIGAWDYAQGQLWSAVQTASIRREAVVDLIDRIAYREQRLPLTIVVLDNATIHHGIASEKLDEWLIEHRLVLMYLPPYSPELNLIEMIWKQAKYRWRRFASWTTQQLFEEVQNLMQAIGSTYQINFA
jgi:transposase